MREEPTRIDGRLEATLRVPDVGPSSIVVIAHPLPTHGGTMRNPVVAAIARACADRHWLALRFNFRGAGASAGEWTNGEREPEDVAAAIAHARSLAPALPVGLAGYSFGARMSLAYLARGGKVDALALAGMPLRDVDERTPLPIPLVPDGTRIVAAERDQFGTADELRRALPRADVVVVRDVDHYFVGKRDEVGALVAVGLARTLPSAVP